MRGLACGRIYRTIYTSSNLRKPIFPGLVQATGKMPQDLKNLPVHTFNKTVRSRVKSRNESLLNSILSTNVSKDLVLKLRAIVSEKDSGSRVWANEV